MSPSSPLAFLQEKLGYRFRDEDLLAQAVTHRSYLQDHPEVPRNNQRLEFLGDAILQVILTTTLFELYPADREGDLTKRRSVLGKGAFLADLAREIGLDDCLRLGANEEASGGRLRDSAAEDAFEALVGALYLDAGLDTTRRVVLGIYGEIGARLAAGEGSENPKGRLQELVQPEHGNQALRYEVLRIDGADHARDYEVGVFLLDRRIGSGRGTSKKHAEEEAARAALATFPSEAGPRPAP